MEIPSVLVRQSSTLEISSPTKNIFVMIGEDRDDPSLSDTET
jgi:hypothetical protein